MHGGVSTGFTQQQPCFFCKSLSEASRHYGRDTSGEELEYGQTDFCVGKVVETFDGSSARPLCLTHFTRLLANLLRQVSPPRNRFTSGLPRTEHKKLMNSASR